MKSLIDTRDMNQDNTPKTPTHRVYFVANEDGERSQWLELGVVFPNKDGGFSILLDREPMGGFPRSENLRLVARPIATSGAAAE